MTRQAVTLPLALLAATTLAAGCGGSAETPPIDREVFIETYVELRLAALESEDFEVDADSRDEILERLGVDQDALLYFADFHGRDVAFMNEVWTEVDRRLTERVPGDA
jgi:hypothetical protein